MGPILSMRDDALQRTGDGLGCTINSDGVEDNFGGDGMIYREVRHFYGSSVSVGRSDSDLAIKRFIVNPVFVENRSAIHVGIVPMSLYNSTEPVL